MKRILTLVLAVSMIFNMLAFCVVAQTEEAVTQLEVAVERTMDTRHTKYDANTDSATVTITVKSENNVDILIKLVRKENESDDGTIVYIKPVLASQNEGTVQTVLSTKTLGEGNYTVIASNGKNETVTKDFTIDFYESSTSISGGNSSETNNTTTTTTTIDNTPSDENHDILEQASKVDNITSAKKTIEKMAEGVTDDVKSESMTSENAALVTGIIAGNISSKSVHVSGKNNSLVVSEASITTKDLETVDSTVQAIQKIISDKGYSYNRYIERELVLKVVFNTTDKATIVITRDLLKILESIDILTIADDQFRISFKVVDLKKEFETLEEGKNFEIYFERVEVSQEELVADLGNITYDYDNLVALAANKTVVNKVSFNKESLDTKATLSIPSTTRENKEIQTVVDYSTGKNTGGKYNAATGMVNTTIGAGGSYAVVENKVDFTDIANKEAAMQEAIRTLAAKGIIEGVGDGKFEPDKAISRAELSTLIVKTLYTNRVGSGFTDIDGKWYENEVKAAQGAGIINGFEDGTFRGDEVIIKNQIIAIAARTLKEQKHYYDAQDPEKYIAQYTDGNSIPMWAVNDIAVATRENLVVKHVDGSFDGEKGMTRGEAALVLKRLFDRL